MSIEVHVCHYMQKWPLVPKGPKRGFCLCTWAILLWYLYRPTPVGHLIGRLLYPDICAWTLWCTNSNQQQASQMFFCVQLCNVVRWCSNVDSQFAWATCSLQLGLFQFCLLTDCERVVEFKSPNCKLCLKIQIYSSSFNFKRWLPEVGNWNSNCH